MSSLHFLSSVLDLPSLLPCRAQAAFPDVGFAGVRVSVPGAWEWVVALGFGQGQALRRVHDLARAVAIAVCVLVFREQGTLGVAWEGPLQLRRVSTDGVMACPCGSANDGGNRVALPAGLCPAIGGVQVRGSIAGGAVPRVSGRLPPMVAASGLPDESVSTSCMSGLCGDCNI